MKQPKLYFCQKDSNYYMKEECLCEQCELRIEEGDAFFIVSEYIKNLQRHKILCVQCTRKHKKRGDIAEFRQGFISRITDLVTPVILNKPELRAYKGETIFSAATSHSNPYVKVIDKTVHALKGEDSFVDKLIMNTPKKLDKKKYKRIRWKPTSIIKSVQNVEGASQ